MRAPLHRHRSGGFTLIELLIGLAVLTLVIIGALQLLETTNRIAAAQASRTDMQQSLRAAQADMIRKVRHLGRGGLPASDATNPLPAGLSIEIRNNVAAGTTIAGAGTPKVLEGTDILIVRAVIDSPIYQVKAVDETTFTIDPPAPDIIGRVIIEDVTPLATLPQDFQPLKELIQPASGNPVSDAIVLLSASTDDVYGVAEIIPAASTFNTIGTVEQLSLEFRGSGGTGNANAFALLSPSGVFPADPLSGSEVVSVGVLEEYRYYVREEYQVEGDNTTPLAPRLSRARFFPNTDLPYAGDAANLVLDVADNIFDLQVALGFDSAFDGAKNGSVAEKPDGKDDDWALNTTTEDEAIKDWTTSDLFFVRITTLARTSTPERGYQAPLLNHLEDHDYVGSTLNNYEERLRHRILLETVVDMRNL